MSWLVAKVFGSGQPAAAVTPATPAQQTPASGGLPGDSVSASPAPKPVAGGGADTKHLTTTGAAAAAAAVAAPPVRTGKVTRMDGKELSEWRKDTAVDSKAVRSAVKGEVVAEAVGALYLMNSGGDLEIRAPRSIALLVREAPFQYAFQIYDHTGKLRLTQPVSNSMQMNYDKYNHSLIWILVLENRTHAWSMEFESVDDEKQFKLQLAIALMETARREDFAKSVGKNDKEWVLAAQNNSGGAPMEDGDGDDDDGVGASEAVGGGGKDAKSSAVPVKDFEYTESKYKPSRFSIEEASSSSAAAAVGRQAATNVSDDDEDDAGSDDGDAEKDSPPPKTKTPVRVGGPAKRATSEAAFHKTPSGPERNTNLAVGMAANRTFVMRGSKIGVFKHDSDDQLEYVNKIPVVKDLAGEIFSPAKAMLHQRDSKMLLLDASKQNTVFCMDLERGQVIEEWNVNDEAKIRNFAPSQKYSQLTNEQQILGVNKNQVFSLDPRLSSKNKLAQNTTYAKAPNMSCVGANGAGHVAVGDLKGEIRMFSEINKRAKTLLPGLGDPVIGIDVTEDGQYILATTSAYLLLIPTMLPTGKTGFQIGMGAEKPTPIKLQLTPQDLVKHDIKRVEFTAAHFNTGANISEEWIVTATGPYIITWNMKRVIRGHTKEYKIKKIYQDVVADAFRYGKEDQVVVTTPDDVYLEKRTITVRKPSSRASAPPAIAGTAASGTAAVTPVKATPAKAKK